MASPEEFAREVMPYALAASRLTGIHPELIVAQAAHETAWGRKAPGNNYFGIKGKGQSFATHEYVGGKRVNQSASFRKYSSPLASFLDWASLMNRASRYAPVRAAKTLEDQIRAMGASGYATDPKYTSKLRSVANRVSRMGLDGIAIAEAPAPPTPRLRPETAALPVVKVADKTKVGDKAVATPAAIAREEIAPVLPVSMTAYAPDPGKTNAPFDALINQAPMPAVPPPAVAPKDVTAKPIMVTATGTNAGNALPAGPFAFDNLLRQAVIGDEAAIRAAGDVTKTGILNNPEGRSLFSPFGGITNGVQQVTQYIGSLPTAAPEYASLAAALVAGNPGMLDAVDNAEIRAAMDQALKGVTPVPANRQIEMPMPRLSPASAARSEPAPTGPVQVASLGKVQMPTTASTTSKAAKPVTQTVKAQTPAPKPISISPGPMPAPQSVATPYAKAAVTAGLAPDKPAVGTAPAAQAPAAQKQLAITPGPMPAPAPKSNDIGLPKATFDYSSFYAPNTGAALGTPAKQVGQAKKQAAAPLEISVAPKQRQISVSPGPFPAPGNVMTAPPPPTNMYNGPSSQAAQSGQPYYGGSGGGPAGPTWSGTSPTPSGGPSYNYSISPNGNTVSWTNSAGTTFTAQRNV